MARINAGVDFGNAVAQPAGLDRVQVSRGAFGGGEGPRRTATELTRSADVQQRQEDVAQAQAIRADMNALQRRQREADARFEAEQRARERADATVAQSKMYGLRDKLGDAIAEIDRGVLDGTVSKDEAPKLWAERSKALIDADLDGVPDAHREAVKLDATGLSERLTSKIGDAVRQRNQKETRSALDQTLEYTQRLALTDPAGARRIMSETLDASGAAAGLDPVQIGKVKQGWVEQTSYTRAFAAVNGAKASNKALAQVEAKLQADQDIDPQRKAGLLAQIENFRGANEARALRAAQHAEIAAARVTRESDSAFQILSGWAMSGKMADPAAASGLIAKLTPTAAAAYKAMAAEIPARTAAAMQPLDVQQAAIDELKTRRNTQGTSQALEAEIKRREQVLSDARKDYGDDPLRAAQERGVLTTPLAPLDVSSMDGLVSGVAVRVQQAQEVMTRTRRPVSPLLPEEAGRVASVLSNLGPTDRAARIAQLASVLPPAQMTALAAQIDSKNRPLYLEMALGASKTASGRQASEWVSRGAQAVKEKAIKEDTAVMTGLRSKIAEFLPDTMPQKWREDAIDAARLIYLGQQAGGNSPSAAGAARVAIGGEVIEHNGAKIPVVGGGMDAAEFKRRLTAAAPAQVQRQAPGGSVFVGGRALPTADLLATIPEAKLIPVGPGRYGIDAGGVAVMNADRAPLILEVR